MNFEGRHYRTVWIDGNTVHLIDQTRLPFEFGIFKARTYEETCRAIRTMVVRGAPAIGAAGGFAMAQAFSELSGRSAGTVLAEARRRIEATRPTGQNLFAAVRRVFEKAGSSGDPKAAASVEAQRIADEDVACCRKIGAYGNELLQDGSRLMTHCNAGWLACVDFGTALSPVYTAHRSGKNLLVFVSETRPRSQGAKLTAWELKNEGVPYTIFADGAGAYLMRKERIDLVIVGADRIARNGDIANKIGTLEKAVAAKEFGVPFYIAAPASTIDAGCADGDAIPIEFRGEEEFLLQTIRTGDGGITSGHVLPDDFKTTNPAFDVTPSKYVTGYITEMGILTPEQLRDYARGISG